jgi:hypothetical protein
VFALPALVVCAKIAMLRARISEMAEMLRQQHDPRDPRQLDDIELFSQMLKYESVMAEAKPLLQACEQLGMLPREVGEIT